MSKTPSLESAGRSLAPAPLSDSKHDGLVYVEVPYASSQSSARSLYVDGIKVNIGLHVPPLADGEEEKRWGWLDLFKRRKDIVDWDAIATRPSVYDDDNLAPHYAPRADYENLHRVDPLARWTFREEKPLSGKPTCAFLALDLDRGNILQANSANFLKDLKLTTNDFNMGNSLAKAGFLIAELPSQLISKKIGPDRWIPMQMCVWSIVAGSQFWLSGRSSFLATRFLVGLCQGGFIPDVILYMSYFYKKSELSMRLALFYTCNYSVNIFAGFLAIGLLQLNGVEAMLDGAGCSLSKHSSHLSSASLPFSTCLPCPTASKTWFRPKGWYTDREEIIMTNRILRDDPGNISSENEEGLMHNRQAISLKMLWESFCDFDLWPLYAVGLVFQLPQIPIQTYLTLAFRELGFSTVTTNLLSIPNLVLAILTLIAVATLSEAANERSFVASLQNLWIMPCLIALYYLPPHRPWAYFAVTTVLLGSPYVHAILVSWVSMNAGSVRTRTVGSSLVGPSLNPKDDAPLCKSVPFGAIELQLTGSPDRRGNRVLIGICAMNLILFPLIKLYYIQRNKYKRAQWEALSPEEQGDYLERTKERGSKRLDFQFFH
ncbi:hypothetical protein BS47DRAFT_1389517 [Hydnum rufescens UP504]|uniref:Phthalate transporter n=1 Tax=Hydnum rufescens UP504 TaxID=1448309 RepID=A0A9P6B7P0_9AGAM|nr:hypothetical protein BS47DRAFT_1389517 [Hydnum rufescens UP504]